MKGHSTEALDLLERDIRHGLFTPVLGPGTSSLWSGEIDFRSSPWKEVALTLTAISSQLSDDRSRNFLRSFTQSRLNLTAVEVNGILPTAGSPSLPSVGVPGLGESLLARLQAELVQATVRVTHYFGERFSQESPSILHCEDYSVEFDLGSESGELARDCLAHLLAAADIALELQSKTGGERESPFLSQVPGITRRLESQKLYAKLLTLLVDLVGRNREAYRDALGKHQIGGRLQIPDEVEQGKSVSFGKLRLDAIQWLSDLLWYTVRYWIPRHPTTTELAFELSLAVKNAPLRQAELAQVAQAVANKNADFLVESVVSLITYCEGVQEREGVSDWQTRSFHCSIAAVLQLQCVRYGEACRDGDHAKNSSLKDSFSRVGRLDHERAGISRVPLPVIFTESFDNSLEMVFEANDLGFHIVFPVLIGLSPEDEGAAPIWLIRTCYPMSAKRITPDKDWMEICDDNGMPTIQFVGPIIVKLHGAPSLSLGDATQQHRLVFSELDYLEMSDTASRPPAWLEQQLGARWGSRNEVGRSLWFLGYSLGNWAARLRLYKDTLEHRRATGGRRCMLDQDADVYRTAILEKLGVVQYFGGLNHLPNMVLRILDDETIDKSSRVSRLLERLKEIYRENCQRGPL